MATARATTVGLDPATGSFSLWDSYAATVFSGKAADSSNTSLLFATLNGNIPSGMVLGGGDRIYAGGGIIDLDINGFAAAQVTQLSLQIKFTAPSAGTSADYFTAKLNNIAATGTLLGTVTEGSNTFSIVQYSWSGLNITAGSGFAVSIDGAADHVSLDAVRITDAPQLAAVPEPGAIGLIGGAGLVFLMRRRRPQVAI